MSEPWRKAPELLELEKLKETPPPAVVLTEVPCSLPGVEASAGDGVPAPAGLAEPWPEVRWLLCFRPGPWR